MNAALQKIAITFRSWPIRAAVTIVAALLVCIISAKINAGGSRDSLLVAERPSKPGARELVVLVHAYRGDMEAMEPIKQLVEAARPDAEVIRFEYPAQTFSDANLFSLAAQMEEKIHELDKANKYERIILSGYSVGALIVRKAYVYGCGQIQDQPGTDGRRAVIRTPRDWVSKVDRFVLLAGMNRGWSREAKSVATSRIKRAFQWAGYQVARLSNTGALMRDTEQGEPFVSNLRIQWLDAIRNIPEDKRPTVIQLLGDQDDLVGGGDSNDVSVSQGFIWVPVAGTGHSNIATVGDSGAELERKTKLLKAFGDAKTVEELRLNNAINKVTQDKDVETVVFVLHGIRDMGDWPADFEKPLQDAYRAKNGNSKTKLSVRRSQYGYFGMGPFLLWSDRQKNVRWFMDEVTELKAQFPNLKEIHFIGHSNGTYILASALRKYAALNFGRAAMAGSVIRRDFPWSDFAGRIDGVRNYVGSADWVVGLGSGVFEKPVFNWFNEDIGSAGFNGFTNDFATKTETRFVKGEHGAGLRAENVESVVNYIINDVKNDVPDILVEKHPGWLGLLANISWVLWIAAALFLFWIVYKSPVFVGKILGRIPPISKNSPRQITWLARGCSLCVIWLILNTI